MFLNLTISYLFIFLLLGKKTFYWKRNKVWLKMKKKSATFRSKDISSTTKSKQEERTKFQKENSFTTLNFCGIKID